MRGSAQLAQLEAVGEELGRGGYLAEGGQGDGGGAGGVLRGGGLCRFGVGVDVGIGVGIDAVCGNWSGWVGGGGGVVDGFVTGVGAGGYHGEGGEGGRGERDGACCWFEREGVEGFEEDGVEAVVAELVIALELVQAQRRWESLSLSRTGTGALAAGAECVMCCVQRMADGG